MNPNLKLLFLSFLSFLFWSNALVAQEEGLIAYYAFDGSAIDSSTFEHHGAVIDAVLDTDLLGQPDRAYRFNGQSSYITAGTPSTLKIDTALTISVWFKALGEGSPSAGGVFVNKEGEYSFARFADGSIRWALAFDNHWDNHINTGYTVPLSENTHAVLTYSQSEGKVKVYINCELIYTADENAIIGDVEPDLNEMRIGGRMFLNQFFDGIIDEVKIYNRALTLEEINENCMLSSTNEILSIADQYILFPNPVANSFQIQGDLSKIEGLRIFSTSGNLVKEQFVDLAFIDVNALPTGVYYVVFYNGKGEILQSSKIVKIQDRA